MRDSVLWVVFPIMVVGCVHPSTTAELYQSNGSFAFASEYQGLAFEQEGRVSQLELTRAIELTRADYRERLERSEKAQAYEDGFAVLNAWVEFEEWVSSQRLSDVTRQDLSALVDRWTGLAQQSLVDSVDALVASNGAPLDVLKLLRRALAIAPNDRELDARYRRLKSALSRQVHLRVRCEPSLAKLCDEVRGLWLGELSKVRRELVHDVEESSDVFDTQLTIRIYESQRYQPWALQARRRHVVEVPVLNEFREPVLDNSGKPKNLTVEAYTAVEAASREVVIQAELDWEDLRDSASGVRQFQSKNTQNSTVEFLQWKGDHRAITSSGLLERVSKSRREPLSSAYLQRRGISSVVVDLFGQWIKEIDQ